MSSKSRDVRINRVGAESFLEFAVGLNDGLTTGDILLRMDTEDIAIGELDGTLPAALVEGRAIRMQALEYNGTAFIADTDANLADTILVKGLAVPEPSSDYDAVNKKYVDDEITTSAANITLQDVLDNGNTATTAIEFESTTGNNIDLIGSIHAGKGTFTGNTLFNQALYGDSTTPSDNVTWPGLTGSSDVKINEYQLNLSLQTNVDDIRGEDLGVRVFSSSPGTPRTADEVVGRKTYFRLGGMSPSGVTSAEYIFFELEPNNLQVLTKNLVSGHRVDINDRSSFNHVITNNVNYYANRPTNGTNNYSFWGKGFMRTDEGLIIEGEHNNDLINVTAPATFTENYLILQDDTLTPGFTVDSSFNTEISGDVNITSTTSSSSVTTGALTVAGGVGIAEDVYIGDNSGSNEGSLTIRKENIGGPLFSAARTGGGSYFFEVSQFSGNKAAWRVAHSTTEAFLVADDVNFPSPGIALLHNDNDDLTQGIFISNGVVTISNTTASTATNDGALIVSGGVGIGEALNVDDGALFNASGGSNDFRINSSGGDPAYLYDASLRDHQFYVNNNLTDFVELDHNGFDTRIRAISGSNEAVMAPDQFTLSDGTNFASLFWQGADLFYDNETGNHVFNDIGADSDFVILNDSGDAVYTFDNGTGEHTYQTPVNIDLIDSTLNGLSMQSPALYTGSYITLQDSTATEVFSIDSDVNMFHGGDITMGDGTLSTNMTLYSSTAQRTPLRIVSSEFDTADILDLWTRRGNYVFNLNDSSSPTVDWDGVLLTMGGDASNSQYYVSIGTGSQNGGSPGQAWTPNLLGSTDAMLGVMGSDSHDVGNALVTMRVAKFGTQTGNIFEVTNEDASTIYFDVSSAGEVTVSDLAGTGERLVSADANGLLQEGVNISELSAEPENVQAGTGTTVNLAIADLGRVITIDNASAVNVNLPSVDTTEIGEWVKIVKLNSGDVTINAADSDLIADSTAGGSIANTQSTQDYATMYLQLVTATRWVVMGFDGTWVTA